MTTPTSSDGATSSTRATRLAALFVLPYLLFGLAWLGASPAGSGPDEVAHLVKAVSVARLDLGAPLPITATTPVLIRNQSISRAVTIPSRLSPAGLLCFIFKAQVTPACQPPPPADTGDLAAVTTIGRHPGRLDAAFLAGRPTPRAMDRTPSRGRARRHGDADGGLLQRHT